jgi:hypothetical protein
MTVFKLAYMLQDLRNAIRAVLLFGYPSGKTSATSYWSGEVGAYSNGRNSRQLGFAFRAFAKGSTTCSNV